VLTAAAIIDRANQIAKGRGMAPQGLDGLNAILSDLCEVHDLALARGQFNFNFDPQLTSLFGSGPYSLPLDYLRTSGSSGARGVTRSAWYLYPAPTLPAAQPIFMTPIDLAEFDLYAKLPSQSTPNLWCTDMAVQKIIISTSANLTAGSTAGTVVLATGILSGMSISGEGIVPGTTITIAGLNITLSQAATITNPDSSVFFGYPPLAYVYPAPLGPYPVTVRYQRKMPPIIDDGVIPWFPNEGFLIEKLASFQMPITGDSRKDTMEASADKKLGKYLGLSDDKTNRSQAVQLDGRNYGRGGGGGRGLRDTKTMGWGC
jgi:hypothetical protein